MDLSYSHCPKPFSGDVDLSLDETAIIALRGEKKARFPLALVERIELRFSPTSLAHQNFTCKVFAQGQTLRFSNISWRSLTDIIRQDQPYRDFVSALTDRAAKANPEIVLASGVSPIAYWITTPTSILILLTLIGTLVYTAILRQWPLSLLVMGMIAYFAYWLRDYIRRNKPRRFTAETIPPQILP